MMPPGTRGSASLQRGAALILVLAALVFLAVLSVAFLASMRSKVLVSKAGADGNTVRLFGDTAVNLVISQIGEAAALSAADSLAWASQPGMIRLYDSSGGPAGYRKLYTWDNMSGTGAFDPFAAGEQVPTSWKSDPAIFTDLNAPANGIYPILDYDKAATNRWYPDSRREPRKVISRHSLMSSIPCSRPQPLTRPCERHARFSTSKQTTGDEWKSAWYRIIQPDLR